MRRLHVHSDETAAGKAFVAFLALIVRSQMHNSLVEYIDANKLTFRKVLLELGKVKLICTSDAVNPARLLNPPTKCQREIMTNLGLRLETFTQLD